MPYQEYPQSHLCAKGVNAAYISPRLPCHSIPCTSGHRFVQRLVDSGRGRPLGERSRARWIVEVVEKEEDRISSKIERGTQVASGRVNEILGEPGFKVQGWWHEGCAGAV